MANEEDIRKAVRNTETWQAWGHRYNLLRFQGKNVAKMAEAHWEPITPDTYDSMMRDFTEGIDTQPFSSIENELRLMDIRAILEHYSAFAGIAVMQFSR